MSRKLPLHEKNEWFKAFEAGQSYAAIATKFGRDLRTVKKGVEEARRELDARTVRSELLKDAVRKHQSSLIETLELIKSGLTIEGVDSAVLSWHDDNILASREGTKGYDWIQETVSNRVSMAAESKVEWSLLQEHLRRDPLWRVIADWEKTKTACLHAIIALQFKIVTILEDHTGYKVVSNSGVAKAPFVYVYPTGDVFFRQAIKLGLGLQDGVVPEADIVADTVTGEVKFRNSILARAPGKEEDCRKNLLLALKALQESPEAAQVAKTHKEFHEAASKAKRTAEELSLLGLIPGQCRICRRLGM